MNRRTMVAMMAAGGAVVAYGANRSATAGGWASLELLNPVRMAVVGVPVTFDAQVLRHGVNPDIGLPASVRLTNDATGDERIVTMEVVSERHALVRGEVTLDAPGTWRMETFAMGSAIDLGQLQAVEAGEGDVISRLRPAPEAAVAQWGVDAMVETEILDNSFADPVLEVAPGTTVTWINASPVAHLVAFENAAFPSSAMLQEGDRFSATFAESGTWNYTCPPHPHMTGTVRVG